MQKRKVLSLECKSEWVMGKTETNNNKYDCSQIMTVARVHSADFYCYF